MGLGLFGMSSAPKVAVLKPALMATSATGLPTVIGHPVQYQPHRQFLGCKITKFARPACPYSWRLGTRLLFKPCLPRKLRLLWLHCCTTTHSTLLSAQSGIRI